MFLGCGAMGLFAETGSLSTGVSTIPQTSVEAYARPLDKDKVSGKASLGRSMR